MTYEPDVSKAVRITTTTTLDHWELGRLFAEWSNEEQYLFLHGAGEGFQALGGSGAMQMHYIADEASKREPGYGTARVFVDRLNHYLNPTEEAKS